MRTLLGFAFAPMVPALLLGGFLPLLGGGFREYVWGVGVAMAIGYPVALVAGLPLFFFLRWCRWVSLWHYYVVGLVLGVPVFCLLFGRLEEIAMLFLSMLCTTIATATFWLIARPDR